MESHSGVVQLDNSHNAAADVDKAVLIVLKELQQDYLDLFSQICNLGLCRSGCGG